MKRKHVWVATTALLAVIIPLLSFYFYTGPTLGVNINASNQATYPMTNVPTPSSASEILRVFVSHGDGTYYLGTYDSLVATHSHQYADNGSTGYSAFAETILLYDDHNKPPERTSSQNFTVNLTGSISAQPSLIQDDNIELSRTTNPVSGDSLTYIIRYEHPGNTVCTDTLDGMVKFQYDTNIFDDVQADLFFDESENETTNGNVATKVFTFTDLAPGQQRSMFVLLHTKDNIRTLTALSPSTNVELNFTDKESCSSIPTYRDTVMVGEMVLASHDPNIKSVVSNQLCSGDSTVTWRIDFQNYGNATEDSVVVSDWIDNLFDFNSVEIVDSKFTVTDIQQRPNTREYRFVMAGSDMILKGMREANVREDETRGYLVLRAKKETFIACNAMANAARIFFGCNPPVTTETALAPFACLDSICDSCTVLLDLRLDSVKVQPAPGNPGSYVFLTADNLPSQLTSLFASNDWAYKWYPSAGMADPFVLYPQLDRQYRRTYTLVASRETNCERVVLRVNVWPEDVLGMDVEYDLAGGCPGGPPIWDLTAIATGRPPTHLVWNNCQFSGVDTFRQGGLSQNFFYVAVWDTLTDQYVERWVNLPNTCPKKPPIPPWVWAVAVVLLLISGYFFFRRFLRKQ